MITLLQSGCDVAARSLRIRHEGRICALRVQPGYIDVGLANLMYISHLPHVGCDFRRLSHYRPGSRPKNVLETVPCAACQGCAGVNCVDCAVSVG